MGSPAALVQVTMAEPRWPGRTKGTWEPPQSPPAGLRVSLMGQNQNHPLSSGTLATAQGSRVNQSLCDTFATRKSNREKDSFQTFAGVRRLIREAVWSGSNPAFSRPGI